MTPEGFEADCSFCCISAAEVCLTAVAQYSFEMCAQACVGVQQREVGRDELGSVVWLVPLSLLAFRDLHFQTAQACKLFQRVHLHFKMKVHL